MVECNEKMKEVYKTTTRFFLNLSYFTCVARRWLSRTLTEKKNGTKTSLSKSDFSGTINKTVYFIQIYITINDQVTRGTVVFLQR